MNDQNQEHKDLIFNELIKKAYQFKEKHSDHIVRVYHCCFSDNKEAINYYNGKEGFKHDEGMQILKHDLKTIPDEINIDFEIIDNQMSHEDGIKQFIIEHKQVFRSSPYTVENILEMQKKPNFKSFTCIHQGKIMGNVFLYSVKDDNRVIGWIDDLFVSKEMRNKKIASALMIKALNYFKSINIDESRLEIWSANKRAFNLYHKLGYQFDKETESSIGMFI